MSVQWNDLQNGSDIRGIAMEGIAGESVNLTPDVVQIIAFSFAKWLSELNSKPLSNLKIGVGRDSRLTGFELSQACFNGLSNAGVHVFDCGIASTPAMFMGTITEGLDFDGSIMLTASHLPFNRNGLKFFTNKGGLDKKDITRILEYCNSNILINQKWVQPIPKIDLIDIYSRFLVNVIRNGINNPDNYEKPLEGFHIIVDAGNGSGGFFANKVLGQLGANTSGSQFLDPDGNFPNHIPNPEDKAAMESISKAVKTNKADLGIIFDTDVDRAAVVDKHGNEINRNKLIALISAIILEEHPGTSIVTDSITSDGLTLFIEEKLKGKHHRFKRGYKNVINEALRLNSIGEECWCAIETSGHAALKENYFIDDGAFLITKILIKAALLRKEGKIIESITDGLKLPAESEEFRIKILDKDFKEYGNSIIKNIQKLVDETNGWEIIPRNYEGIRVSCSPISGNGWFLLRLSLHDPVIPLNIESDIPGGVRIITEKLVAFFKQYSQIDIKSIENYLNK